MAHVIRSFFIFFFVGLPLAVIADDINVPVPNTDSRSTPPSSGVFATENWSSSGGGFQIQWNITQSGPNFHYIYTISNQSGGNLAKDLSHILFEVSPSINTSNVNSIIFNANPSISDGPKTFGPSDPSNPGIPGDLYGIKFENFSNPGQPTIEFDSTRAPIWGDFYSKDGKNNQNDVFAYNTGFGTDPTLTTTDFTPWIPIPDTGDGFVIPEPRTWLILTLCLAIVAVLKHKYLNVKTAVKKKE